MRNVLMIAGMLMVQTLAGCGGADKPAETAPAAPKAQAAAVVDKEAPVTAATLAVVIIPDPPTADGCLKALTGGLRQATYRWEINGGTVEGNQSELLCGGVRRGDVVTATVVDGAATGSARATIANAPPRFTEVAVNAEALALRDDLVVRPTVVDADGDPVALRYQWYVNEAADPVLTTDTLPGGRYVRGDAIRFTIVAGDGFAESPEYRSATALVPNAPPRILSEPPQRFEAHEYRYQAKAKDADGDPLAWRLDKAPPGMTISSAGLVAWPLAGVKAGSYSLKIVVSDPAGAEAFQEYTLTLGTPTP